MLFGSNLVDNNHCSVVRNKMRIKSAYAIVAGNYKKTLIYIAFHQITLL